MSVLVIVESPTKARTLSRFLGKNYRIEATMGHVRDLPEKKLGIDIRIQNLEFRNQNDGENLKINNDKKGAAQQEKYEFVPQYQIISARKTRVAELKKLAQENSPVILATDPDREGEAIAWHVQEILKIKNKNSNINKKEPTTFQRIVFHEITQSAIADALKHPKEIDEKLVDAQQARRILDRLVGYKLSPLLWNKLGKNWLSAGRVQSVAVRLIVEREREIKAFVPVEYWLIDAQLSKNIEHKTNNNEQRIVNFIARLFEVNGKKSEVKDKATADAIVSDLEKASYTVSKVESKEVRRYPVPPFTTSTMQQAASNRFGWSAKKTMRAAQNLYEQGLITYHRTDSTNLSSEAIGKVREFINELYGRLFLPDSAKFYKTKSKVAQEAHEAIRPTDSRVLGDYDMRRMDAGKQSAHHLKSLPSDLGRDEQLLYSLIWKRFLACQMNEAVFDQTTVSVTAVYQDKSYLLRATGRNIKFDGWLTLYSEVKSEKLKDKSENQENADEDILRKLPKFAVNEPLVLQHILPQQKYTEPPPRYNEASLIKALEEMGIGRPSTYAPIISTIQDRKYVEKMERKFYPTDLGGAVTDFLVAYFPEIFDVTFTARMEDELDSIANGLMKWGNVLNNFYTPFADKLSHVFKEAKPVKVDLGTSDEKCPRCGNPLAYRISRFGKFLACSTYPKCKFTKNIVEKAGIPCPKCGGDIILRRTRRGKQFYGCSNYPKCTFAAWKKEDIK